MAAEASMVLIVSTFFYVYCPITCDNLEFEVGEVYEVSRYYVIQIKKYEKR